MKTDVVAYETWALRAKFIRCSCDSTRKTDYYAGKFMWDLTMQYMTCATMRWTVFFLSWVILEWVENNITVTTGTNSCKWVAKHQFSTLRDRSSAICILRAAHKHLNLCLGPKTENEGVSNSTGAREQLPRRLSEELLLSTARSRSISGQVLRS